MIYFYLPQKVNKINMNRYKKLNIIFGWLSFLVAAVVYLMTMEPTVSLWDCGEFIASAYKLEVGHPPGAPFFMIMARFFSLFASDVSKVAMMINSMSALASAFTILFLFWTITHLASKTVIKDNDINEGASWAVIGSGLVGALAYTFSDTFWFSAVEGEVYAFSSLFTAVVFWAILKWENVADEPYSNRWLILIAYLMGLSIGVHLLNLLAIPAIVFVYYFKKYEVNRKGVFGAFAISMIILGSIMYGIIPGMVTMASKFELAFVNNFGLGYNSGVYVYIILLLASLAIGIYSTFKNIDDNLSVICAIIAVILLGIPFMSSSAFLNVLLLGGFVGAIIYYLKKKREILNTVLLFLTVIVIGYSSFSMIVIRSLADPPMDENNPDNVFSLLAYLNREQYGERPLAYGQYFSAPMVDIEDERPIYTQKDGKYVISDYKRKVVYHEELSTIFPRMYSAEQNHIDNYKKWGKIKGHKKTIRVNNQTQQVIAPTFGENLRFFFSYQLGFMYGRYFMWNFAGRQNDEQSHGELMNGHWISGIPFIDNMMIGPQENLPDKIKNHPGRNTYYMLPLLLGLLGLIFQAQKSDKGFIIVLLLFILTGIAIVVYLNQYPNQPRERDYAYAGSFYAFAIWVGLGVLAIFDSLGKSGSGKIKAIVSTVLCLVFIPGIMAKENWDDHDRSGRYTARDMARNYLESCAPNAILFTNGDNDTFPLWYAQEVEGIRTDVRVCNLMLLNTDWYIDQMKRKAYESDPLPISMTKDQYVQGTRDIVFLLDKSKEFADIKAVLDFIKSDNPQTKVPLQSGSKADFVPTKNYFMKIDFDKIIETGTVKEKDIQLVDSVIAWNIGESRLTKSDLAVLDILANNNWERPIYFVSLGHSGTLNLDNYMQLEGFAYRLVPINTSGSRNRIDDGRIDSEIMYENLMNKFTWGRMNEPDVLIDYYTKRNFAVMRIKNKFLRLAVQLLEEEQNEKAQKVIEKAFEILPDNKVPYDYFNLQMINVLFEMGAVEQAEKHVQIMFDSVTDELDYYTTLNQEYAQMVASELRMASTLLMQLNEICQHYHSEHADEINMKVAGYGLI